MRNVILVVFIFCGCSVDRQEVQHNIPEVKLALEDDYILGQSRDENSTEYFGNVEDVVVIDGLIFIADGVEMTIKVFDSQGNFVRHIGERGQGPGEFQYFTSLIADKDNHLFVWDHKNKRLSKFEVDGTLLDTYEIPRWVGGHQVEFLDNDRILLLGLPPNINNQNIFHIIDINDMQKSILSFGNLTDVANYEIDTLTREFFQGREGKFALNKEKSILYYAPEIYEGFIFVFKKGDKKWSLLEKKQGLVKYPLPFEYEKQRDSNQDYNISMTTIEGTFYFKIYNESLGLFLNTEGKLVHFTAVETADDNTRSFCVELFEPEKSDSATGYHCFESRTPQKYGDVTSFNYFPKAIDDEDNFYVYRYGYPPTVHKLKILGNTDIDSLTTLFRFDPPPPGWKPPNS